MLLLPWEGSRYRSAAIGPVSSGVVSNFAILGYFKYYNFFVDSLNPVLGLTGLHLPVLEILLPAGISFYTFKSMSYTIDVYKGHMRATRSLVDYLGFVSFFPHLVAGPIMRATVLFPEPDSPTRPKVSPLGMEKETWSTTHFCWVFPSQPERRA